MSWQVEIQDASLTWQDISTGQIQSISAGTGSESQIIPDVSISFKADVDLPAGLLDPETNRDSARLRIIDGDSVRYFRIETLTGSVSKALDYPQITGRAYAGILTEWPAVTYDFLTDIPAADMARRICTRHVQSNTGTSVGVVWLATNNPTIPGGRFQVSRRGRWELLKEIVEMCGAKIRVSTDGRTFEVYDAPSMALTESATRTFTDAQSLSYELQRVKQPGNAIRVHGEQADYTRPLLPVVRCSVSPTAIDADETSTATATATVYDNSGNLVQHKAIIDESISAGSYTEIPVSGCYAVQAVWLNSGTYESPTKSTRITPTSFTASVITVPDNSNQLFIVSYTQAEAVSFSLADQSDEILGEAQTTTGALAVSTDNAIGRVIGVYRATDTNRAGTNFYTGGSATANTTSITLGISPGATGQPVVIDYETYNGTPLSATGPSPASALCNASGQAQSTIGAGATVGTAKITASALGQEGSCWLSLLGSAVGSMTLTSDKSQLLASSSREGYTAVSETNLTVKNESTSMWVSDAVYYVVTQALPFGMVTVSFAGGSVTAYNWMTTAGENRVYFKPVSAGTILVPDSSTVDVTYETAEEVEVESGQATITATVLQDDGTTPASDGTPISFSLSGLSGCSLSAAIAYTTDGTTTVTLTAGSSIGTVTVMAICGTQVAEVRISIVSVVTDDTALTVDSTTTGTHYPRGSSTDSDDDPPEDSDSAGNICGSRKLVDCDGNAIGGSRVSLDYGDRSTFTDDGGWFGFCVPSAGTYSGSVDTDGDGSFSFSVTDPAAE